ncbi:MAG: TGS domain-containing protein [Deltaproteobacteria bacterium]|nr:TGS domain-containing protein [Deltaproteobacteria bacterium]
MPANLPPHYHEAEKVFREAKTTEEKIEAIKTMMAIIPKHKGTDKLRGELRRKLSKLKEEEQQRKKRGKKGSLYNIEREGAGQVAIVGLPNSGKSQIVSALTSAPVEIADYPFSTRTPVPGMMTFENVRIQLIDLPPIEDEFAKSWLSGILRNCDLILLVVDGTEEPAIESEIILDELLNRYKIKAITPEEEEVKIGNITKRVLIVVNKIDLLDSDEKFKDLEKSLPKRFPFVKISAKTGQNLDILKRSIFDLLNIIRIYTKSPGKEPDLKDPVILKKGSTVLDFARQIHKDFAKKLKYARIWGKNTYAGQRIQKDYILHDEDVVELHI